MISVMSRPDEAFVSKFSIDFLKDLRDNIGVDVKGFFVLGGSVFLHEKLIEFGVFVFEWFSVELQL
jgi:hypothetical protein